MTQGNEGDAITTPGVTAGVLAYINWRLTALYDQAQWSQETTEWASDWVCKGTEPPPDPWPPPPPIESLTRDLTGNLLSS